MPYDCFISYSSIDLGYAQELYDKLTEHHFKVWFDKVRLNPGYNWHIEIEAGCDNSRILLPILTPNWKKSEWTKFETYSGEYIIPLIIEGEWDEICTPPLEKFQAEKLDFTKMEMADWEKLFSHISKRLTDHSPEKSKRVISLKYLSNPHFVGRENDLIKIHELFHVKPTAKATQGRINAIIGNGGYGKTTLARQYAEKFWKSYDQVLWVDGRLNIESEFAFIYDYLFPERIYSGLQTEEKAREALNELNTLSSRLLIIDNVEDEKSIKEWIPKVGGCYVLITSRNANWSTAIWKIELEVLSPDEALAFLQRHTGRELIEMELIAAKELAKKLGNLPLALEQAAAYIEQQGTEFGFSDYSILLAKATRELLEAGTPGSTDYEKSVFATWKPSIDKMPPNARTMLRLAAHFGTSQIPFSIFEKGAHFICELTNKIYGLNNVIEGDIEFWVRNNLTQLKNYCLIKYEGLSISLHPLLQTIERISNIDEFAADAFQCAEEIFITSVPIASWAEDRRIDWKPENDDDWKQLLPHGLALMEFNENKCSSKFLREISNAYASAGNFAAAVCVCQKAYDKSMTECGENALNVFDILEDLAYLYRGIDNYTKSEELFNRVYSKRKEIQGIENEFTLRTLHNIAIVERLLGKFEQAYERMNYVLECRVKQFGDTNYYTLTSVHDIGYLLDGWGKDQEAIPYYKKALEVWEINPGPGNPDTITANINLTGCYKSIKDYESALKYNQKAIEWSSKKQGRNLIYYERSCSDKISILKDQNKFQEAIEYCRELIIQLNEKFGYLDPITLKFNSKLSYMYIASNKNSEAFEVYAELLKKAKLYLPVDHPVYQRIIEKLAYLGPHSTDIELINTINNEFFNLNIKNNHLNSLNYFDYGNHYFDLRAYSVSKKYYLKCKEIRSIECPNTFEMSRALNGLSAACIQLEEWDEAEVSSIRAMEISPNFPNPVYWLAKAYEGRKQEGDKIKEFEAWKKYLELGPTSEERKKEAEDKLKLLA